MSVILVTITETFEDWRVKTNDISLIVGDFANLVSSETSLVRAVNENFNHIGDLVLLTTTDKTDIVSAINEIDNNVDSNTVLIGTLGLLTTSDKSSLVNAINELDGEVGLVSSLTTDAKTNLVAAINEVDSNIDTNIASIGTLLSLSTTVKTDLVSAINEVDANTDTNTTSIGTLASLTTTAQADLVVAVNEVDANNDTNTTSIGTLASLTTTAQADLVVAVNEVDGIASQVSDITYLGTAFNAVTDFNEVLVYGIISGTAASITPSAATPALISTYGSSLSQGVTVATASGTVTVPTTGNYIVTGKLLFTCVTLSAGYELIIDNDTVKTTYDTLYVDDVNSTTQRSMDFSIMLPLTATDVLSMFVEADTVGADLTAIIAELKIERKS